jgi:hypothetical protein
MNSGLNWSELTGPTLNAGNYYEDIEIDEQGSIYLTDNNEWNNAQGHFVKYENGNWIDLSSQFGVFGAARISKPYGGSNLFISRFHWHS